MRPLIISIFLLISFQTIAQHKFIFSSQNYIGLLEGERGSAFQLQTVNGTKYHSWFTGVGTGIDWYYRRSIPLFLSIEKHFIKNGARNFYLTANSGVNFPWKSNNNYNEFGYSVQSTPAGFYGEGGLGYKIGLGKKNDALLLQSSYTFKHIRENVKNIIYYYPDNLIPGPLQTNTKNHLDYYLQRWAFKIGWSF